MRERISNAVTMTYEIAATERVMRSCPSYLFHRSHDGTGWLAQGKIRRTLTAAAFLKNTQDNNACRKMSAQPPKKKTHGTAQKKSPPANVQWLAIRFRSDQRIGCKTVPSAAIAQMNSNIARTTIKKNPAFMSCITGIIPPPSFCSTRPLRQTEPGTYLADVSAY